MTNLGSNISTFFVCLLYVAFIVGIYALVGILAHERNRIASRWILVSLIISPFIAIGF